MKSICMKTNNSKILDYLLKSFENMNIENTYISMHHFKHYHNIILHHKGKEHTAFVTYLANILAKAVITFYEKDLIADKIELNYFYFHSFEKKQIFENTIVAISDDEAALKRYQLIYSILYDYLKNTHVLFLQSCIYFLLTDYMHFLNHQIDSAVNQYLINKEYLEFVNILKLYIQSESMHSQVEHLHLIYQNKTSIIVDDQQNIISCNDNLKKAKYISDISFSSNDFALNTLLNLIPKTITIHLVDHYCDEFINTLKLIFQDQVHICKDCDICHFYRRKEIKQ